MNRHERGLTDTKGEEEEQDRCCHRARTFRENTAHCEFCCACNNLRADDSGEQECERCTHKNKRINCAAAFGFGIAFMRDQWESRNCQGFIKNKERNEVSRSRNTHRAENSDGDKSKKPGLVFLIIAAHITERKERV